MTVLRELLDATPAALPPLEHDPFEHPDVVAESNLAWVHYDAIGGVLALLLDLRVSLGGLGEADTALIVARGCRGVRLLAGERTDRYARRVDGLHVERTRDGVAGRLTGVADVSWVCDGVDVSTVDVAGLPRAQVDYPTASAEEVTAATANLWSVVTPLACCSLTWSG